MLLAACEEDAEPGPPWMAPAEVAGKADAPGTLLGSDIPSDFVDEDSAYLRRRVISSLEEVGALDEATSSLASRADGVVAALPTDGALDVEELVRMEESPFFDLLTADEQDAFPVLWALFEVPDTPVVEVSLEAEAFEIEDRSSDPGALQLPETRLLSEFPAAYRPTLERLQLAFDDDDDAGTVSLDDLDEALATPAPFTPAEIADLEAARQDFLDTGTTAASAVLAVPTPTLSIVEDSVAVGEVVFARTSETSISETRSIVDNPGALNTRTFNVELTVERTSTEWPQLGNGQTVIALETSTNRERVLREDAGHLSEGLYLVELWDGGERVSAEWASLPRLSPDVATLEIPERVGHEFEAFDGEPFVRALKRTTDTDASSGHVWTAHYRWNVSGQEHTEGTIIPTTVERTELPDVSLLPGRYRVELGEQPVFLDLFPQGAARATLGDEVRWMHLHGTDLADHMAKKFTAEFERGTVTFRPASVAVDLESEDGQRFSTEVLQSDREG